VVEVVQHTVVAVEALVHRPHAFDEAEMPFADAARGVTGGLENLRQRRLAVCEAVSRIRPQHSGGESDTAWILPGHERGPRGRAERGSD